jgi:ketosteroid isomerase-like protein
MKTADELFNTFLPLARTPDKAAALFAEDGVVELPYLADIGMSWQYRGRGEIAGLYTRLLELVPAWAFSDVEVLIKTPDRLFAEYHVDAWAVQTQRPFRQHFFGYLLAENGQIKVLREALNVVTTARAFFPQGLAALAPLPEVATRQRSMS